MRNNRTLPAPSRYVVTGAVLLDGGNVLSVTLRERRSWHELASFAFTRNGALPPIIDGAESASHAASIAYACERAARYLASMTGGNHPATLASAFLRGNHVAEDAIVSVPNPRKRKR